MTLARLLALIALCMVAGLACVGGLWMLWLLATPSDAILRFIGWP